MKYAPTKINNNPNCYLCGVEKRKIEKIKVKWYCRICNLKYRDYKKQVGIRIPLKCFRGKKHIFTNEKLKIIGEFLIVHHITYFNVGNEDSGDLVVLCRICHKKIHTKKGVANAGGV